MIFLKKIVFLIITIGLVSSPMVIAKTIENEQQIIGWLTKLDPLPKIHYSYPLPLKRMSDDLLFEYARITNAISISGEWHKEKDIDRVVRIAKKVNELKPKNPVSIGINYSIWHRRFGKNLSPMDTGVTYTEELELLKENLESIKKKLAKANLKYDDKIEVSRLLFDSERFHIKPDNVAWNKAITEKYDSATDIVKDIFPKVKIEWYGRGAIQNGSSKTGWEVTNFFSLKEKGNSFNCTLYTVPEIGITREIFRKTVKLALKYKQEEVTPWVALASGYRRKLDTFQVWSPDWNYDLIYSWNLGAEINLPWFSSEAVRREQRFAPWNMAKIVVFYPPPFDQRTPHWAKHFVAYVRGAHDIKKLP